MEGKYSKILTWISIIGMMIGMFLLNYFTPLYADDYNYLFSFATGERIKSLKDIFPSMLSHYYTMNGRIVLHALDQLFLLCGKSTFNVINTCAYLLLIVMIGYHGCGYWKKQNWDSLGLIFFLLWWCVPAFGHSFFWVTGASNYLYGILIILLFLIPYRKSWDNKVCRETNIVKETLRAVIMLILGMIAGATNENTSVAMVGMILLFLYYFKKRNIKWRFWMFFGLIGAGFGCIFMLIAPAQQNRLENAGGMGNLFEFAIRGIHITMDMWSNMIIMILLICLLYNMRIQKEKGNALNQIGIVYGVGFLLSVYSMVAVPVFVDRVWSGPIILACTAVEAWYDSNRENIVKNKKSYCALMIIMALSFLFTYGKALTYVKRTYDAVAEREVLVQQQKDAGRRELVLPIIYGYTKYSCYTNAISDGDLSPYEEYWGNVILARYYGVDRIKMQ